MDILINFKKATFFIYVIKKREYESGIPHLQYYFCKNAQWEIFGRQKASPQAVRVVSTT